jgi:hypothetical protein
MVMRNADRVIVSSTASAARNGHHPEGRQCARRGDRRYRGRTGGARARIMGGHGLLQVSVGPLGLRSRVAKRAFDVGAAGWRCWRWRRCCWWWRSLEDRGPVFFIQRRVGGGTAFSRS